MTTVADGAFDLDAAFVLVQVDPRRGCAELYRLLAGEVAGFSRALGVDDVGGAVDEVFDRAFTSIADFPGHARDFRLDVLRTTAAIARERSDDDNGSERAAAVLFSAFGCSADDVALITGLSPDLVAACEPRPAAQRDHRRRFRLDDPPAPGPAVTAHLRPRGLRCENGGSAGASVPSPAPTSVEPFRPKRLVAIGLVGIVFSLGLAVVADVGNSPRPVEPLATTGSDVVLTHADATPRPTPDPVDRPRNSSGRIEREAPASADDTRFAAWSYDLGEAGRVVGTIDADMLDATMEPAAGWTVDVDLDTPPWLQATFTDGTSRVRFLAIAEGSTVRVWVFDLDPRTTGNEVHPSSPPPTVSPADPPARPRPTPTPTPRQPSPSLPQRPDPAEPEAEEDLADPTPVPSPSPTETPAPTPPDPDTTPTPNTTPTPDEPDTTPTPDDPDEPDTTPTPDDPDEPDTTPTPDDPDEPDEERSGNSGPGRGSDSDAG